MRSSHSDDTLAAPSHLLIFMSFAVEPSPGFLTDLLGFQPNGLSETPLYKQTLLEDAEARRLMLCTDFFVRSEVVRDGDFGPAIVNAILMLIAFCIFKNERMPTSISASVFFGRNL